MNLNQVTIPSRDVVRSVEFYRRLGLKLIVDSIPRYARFECPSGDSTFSIHHVDSPAPAGGVIVYFECDDLDCRVTELKAAGITFDIDPVDQTWKWREAHLRDPDGHPLILYHAGENRKHPPWRVDDE